MTGAPSAVQVMRRVLALSIALLAVAACDGTEETRSGSLGDDESVTEIDPGPAFEEYAAAVAGADPATILRASGMLAVPDSPAARLAEHVAATSSAAAAGGTGLPPGTVEASGAEVRVCGVVAPVRECAAWSAPGLEEDPTDEEQRLVSFLVEGEPLDELVALEPEESSTVMPLLGDARVLLYSAFRDPATDTVSLVVRVVAGGQPLRVSSADAVYTPRPESAPAGDPVDVVVSLGPVAVGPEEETYLALTFATPDQGLGTLTLPVAGETGRALPVEVAIEIGDGEG